MKRDSLSSLVDQFDEQQPGMPTMLELIQTHTESRQREMGHLRG